MSENFKDGRWLNEPASCQADETSRTMTTDEKTDFWRETYHCAERPARPVQPEN